MSEAQLTSYEDVPYLSRPNFPTHPDCLATVATLAGLRPAPVERCRVLELGCATGGNLIPMADTLPGSHFVGIDLSPSQIAVGQAEVDALGLTNLDLRALSILDVDESLGKFDYIICHGVYSWVPPAVQDKILEICRRHLHPQGVAYISYNTYPGWHARGMVREMMNYHARRYAEPTARVGQARAFLDFLTRSAVEPDSAYGHAIREEAELLRPKADYYVFHEHLEDINQPLYFHQFAERIAEHELQFLGEAWPQTNLTSFSSDATSMLDDWAQDPLDREQYSDFLTNRTFRRTLVCHRQAKLSREPTQETLFGLYASAIAEPMSDEPDVASTATEKFRVPEGASISTNMPLVKAALVSLAVAWPGRLSLEDLWTEVRQRLAGTELAPDDPATGRKMLADVMLTFYRANMAALHVQRAPYRNSPDERPLASPMARRQSAAGAQVVNRRHRIVDLGAADRLVLSCLDGQHDRAALLTRLEEATTDWARLDPNWQAALDPRGRRLALESFLDESLARLARGALLAG